MGITIVQKSDLTKKRPHAVKALILSGGAVTGGSFKAGGIKAFNDYLSGFTVNDFDCFVGISSGSLLVTPLVGGISPESVLKSLDGTSRHFSPLSAWHYYRPNVSELISRPISFMMQAATWLPGRVAAIVGQSARWPGGFIGAILDFVRHPTDASYEELMAPLTTLIRGGDFPSLMGLLPSGLFDNRPIERYIRTNIERNGLTNDFVETERLTGKRLYISAMRLDGASRVVFGPDEETDLSISEAIQASTAMPGFYRPATIRGVDYVDGGVRETANIDVAIDKGAELIVCYNPFRPYDSQEFVRGMQRSNRRLASSGVLAVLNQIFRAFFHSRLTVALDHFRESDRFHGDIILIEPRADDLDFFALNPLALANRVEAARLGFVSVRNSIEERFDEMAEILAAYGITMSRSGVDAEYQCIAEPDATEQDVQFLLEGRSRLPAKKAAKRTRRGRSKTKKKTKTTRKKSTR